MVSEDGQLRDQYEVMKDVENERNVVRSKRRETKRVASLPQSFSRPQSPSTETDRYCRLANHAPINA
jgi:hypothetical protein